MKINLYPLKQIVRFAFAILLVFQMNTTQAQSVCGTPNTLFGLDLNGALYPINSTTGVAGTVYNSASYAAIGSYTAVTAGQTLAPNVPNGMGYNNTNGKFYYFKRNPNGSNKQFIAYTPSPTNKYTTLAAFPGSNYIASGCINFAGTGYYCIDANANLYYYNIGLNTWTFITSTFKDQFNNNITNVFQNLYGGDMAVDALNNLWIMPSDANNYGLYELKAPLPTTGVASVTLKQVIAPTAPTPTGYSVAGFAFDVSGNIYFSTSDANLYKMRSSGSAPAFVGAISAGIMTDLSSCSYPLTVLPQTWNNFTATLKNGESVVLNWTVSQDEENKEFHIERSADGINWQVMGVMANNAGTSNTYNYSDLHPLNASNFYRIAQVNVDGSQSYSGIRELVSKNSYKISMSPNPVTDILNIQTGVLLNNTNNYALGFDFSGRVMFKTVLQSGNNKIDMHSYPAGTYLIQVHAQNGDVFTQKIVKQ